MRLRLATLGVLLALPVAAAAQSVREVALLANDLIYDPVRQVVYASVPSSVGAGGNTITVLDPASGAVGASVFVGSEPGPLAISDDAQFLYVGLRGTPAIRRVDLQTFTATQQFTLGNDPNFGPYYVDDLEVAPGQPLVVAVTLRRLGISPRHGGVAIFDNGVARPTRTADHSGSNVIEFSVIADRLYGFNTESSEAGFRRLAVDSAGVSQVDIVPELFQEYTDDIVFEGGRIFSSGGTMIDAEARTVLGTFTGITPPFDRSQVRPAGDRGVVFFLTGDTLRVFNASTFVPIGTPFVVPGVVDNTRSLIRVGATGLAFRTASGQVFVLDVPLAPLPPTPPLPPPTPPPPPPPPPPTDVLDVSLSLDGCQVCAPGATLTVSGRVTSTSATPVRVEVKAGLGLPDGSELPMSTLGQSHFEIALPPQFSTTVSFLRVTLPAGVPRGTWTYEVSLVSPGLGRPLARDVITFVVP